MASYRYSSRWDHAERWSETVLVKVETRAGLPNKEVVTVLKTAWQWLEPVDLSLGDNLWLAIRPYERDDDGESIAVWTRAPRNVDYRRAGRVWAFRRRGLATQNVELDSAPVLEALALREMMEEMGRG